MSAPKKILVRGVNWLGDAVMTTPALLRLRERFREAEITILSPEKLGALYLEHPAVDRVLLFGKEDNVFGIGRWLRDEQFDLAIVFPNSPRSALEVFLSLAPERVGYARPWRNWMLTRRITERPNTVTMRKRTPAEVRARIADGARRETFPASSHHVHHYLHLVGEMGCNPAVLAPLVHVNDHEVAAISERLQIGSRPVFGLNPGAEYGPAKRWPEERFVEAALALHRETNCLWLILGGRGDRELAARLAKQLEQRIGGESVRNIAGETSLRELCAVVKRCDLLLTNDTGPMHVAAAVGTSLVVPFGSTSPELTGPGLPGGGASQILPGEAECAPCFLRECPVDFRCMKNISVEVVVQAALKLRQRAPIGRCE
jgi:heptosyltransferase-2